jgi:uncharacterized membrane protein
MIGHVQSLQRQQLITVADAAFVIYQKNGKVKVKQANSLVGSGVLGGAFWGLLIGQYLWVSPCTETDANATVTKELGCGIDDDFLKEVSCTIKPGYSALLMMVAYITEEIMTVLAGQSDSLLYTTLSREHETQLREAFGIVEEV